ncbi:MOSC domain-containing protein [Alicyclobacillus acidiphilus]|uniref:MOSC domain-containing protein n=1 Tax=Alicyclobacillus acidiphilus TaxID=182455 RepID=UPI0008358DA9|nr:MOSC domain-containing protein [Alicyclobacillus acidiphilus]
MPRIASIQIGRVETLERVLEDGDSRPWQTAFRKSPVDRAFVAELGLDGDAQADRKHHGGPDKAVLFYAKSHYSAWRERYPRLAFEDGGFGENLTIEGLDETAVCLGDTYRIADIELQVSQPRIPCWKISERWREPTLTDEVRKTGWTGWYVRVKRGGALVVGDRVELVDRPLPEWPISRLNDHLFGRREWTAADCSFLRALDMLADGWKAVIPKDVEDEKGRRA